MKGELFDERPAVVEKTSVPFTKIVQPRFSLGCLYDAILRATAVTHLQNIAFPAIAG